MCWAGLHLAFREGTAMWLLRARVLCEVPVIKELSIVFQDRRGPQSIKLPKLKNGCKVAGLGFLSV